MIEDDLLLPPFATRPNFTGPNVKVWITESPAGLVTWIPPEGGFTIDDANAMTGATALLRAIPTERWLFMHDFYHGISADSLVRRALVDWGKTWNAKDIVIRISARPNAPVLIKMTVEIGLMAMRIAGVDIATQENIRPDMRALGMRPITNARLEYYRQKIQTPAGRPSEG